MTDEALAAIRDLADDPEAQRKIGNAFLLSLAQQRKVMAVSTITPEQATVAARAAILALAETAWRVSTPGEPTELWPGGPVITFHEEREFRVVDDRLAFRSRSTCVATMFIHDAPPAEGERFFVGDRAKQPGEYSREPAVYGERLPRGER